MDGPPGVWTRSSRRPFVFVMRATEGVAVNVGGTGVALGVLVKVDVGVKVDVAVSVTGVGVVVNVGVSVRVGGTSGSNFDAKIWFTTTETGF